MQRSGRFIVTAAVIVSALVPGVGTAQSVSPTRAPVCAHQGPPAAITNASHPNDGVPDPKGRIVFGHLTRVDDLLGQIVSLNAIDPDGSDLVQLLDCEVERPRFSPDGSRLAFGIHMDDGTLQVATAAADGSDLRILTSTEGYAGTPDWSPDGSWLAYAHSPAPCVSRGLVVCVLEEGIHPSLWRIDADGSNAEPLGNTDMFDWEPKVSPDGREVVFTRFDLSSDIWLTLMIRDLGTGVERVVTANEREPEHPEWSPDGQWIIYNTLHGPGDLSVPLEQIERVPADDSAAVPFVLYRPEGGGLGAAKPTYAPDGSGIAFGCSRALCRMDQDGSNVVELYREPGVELNHFAWGPSTTRDRPWSARRLPVS